MRLFIAANISNSNRRQIMRLQTALKRKSTKANFTKLENLHITLKFLGDVDEPKLNRIKSILSKLELPAYYELNPREIVAVKGRNGSLIRLDLDDNDSKLSKLARDIDLSLHRLGFPLEKRQFLPHITLARRVSLRASLDDSYCQDFVINITSISLYLSEFTNNGMRYTPLTTINL